jgi:hypothetical protein
MEMALEETSFWKSFDSLRTELIYVEQEAPRTFHHAAHERIVEYLVNSVVPVVKAKDISVAGVLRITQERLEDYEAGVTLTFENRDRTGNMFLRYIMRQPGLPGLRRAVAAD